uniref:WGS project CAEQ00000000 data, annotated contig 1533 n=1 Tax=Trypanosoma congolense (strain IL3000) TaxID=1068625 RepID=F9W6Y1_TRYCI|nr:unnamed protein product [Trypanosoma congolense IL3000]
MRGGNAVRSLVSCATCMCVGYEEVARMVCFRVHECGRYPCREDKIVLEQDPAAAVPYLAFAAVTSEACLMALDHVLLFINTVVIKILQPLLRGVGMVWGEPAFSRGELFASASCLPSGASFHATFLSIFLSFSLFLLKFLCQCFPVLLCLQNHRSRSGPLAAHHGFGGIRFVRAVRYYAKETPKDNIVSTTHYKRS